MPTEITRQQVGNAVLPNDADALTPEDIAALEAEKAPPPEPAQPEPQRQEPETPEPVQTKDRPDFQTVAELKRLREQRDELRAREAEKERRLHELEQENLKWRARQEYEEESRQRLEALRKQSERPDPAVDPYGAELYDQREELSRLRSFREKFEEQQRFYQQQQQAMQTQAQELQSTQDYMVRDEQAYLEQTPDYLDAKLYMFNAYVNFWTKAGLDQVQAAEIANRSYLGAAITAQKKGGSIAQAIYDAAKQFGYQGNGQRTQAQTQSTTTQQGNAADRIQRVQKAQKMQGLGGKTPAERTKGEEARSLTAEQIADLSDDAYIKMKQDPQLGPLLDMRLEELG